MPEAPPRVDTLGALRRSGWRSRPLRQELREHLLERLRAGNPLFTGILGYDDTVVPAVENAILCGHDLIFLGERGQAKTRMIRQFVGLLDEWLPVVAGSEIQDDPEAPVSAYARRLVAERGGDTPIAWVHREARYVEKLATPDVSIADLIGDVDPVRVAEGRSLGDERTLHFGLLPRANRGIFCINELPDLTEKVQVGLFNVMQERDVQVKGYRVRLPLDVLVVASANPEDYTSRGRIITPLKDRYAAQIRTHYPPTREIERAVVRQEARLPEAPGIALHVPGFLEDLVAEMTLQARASADVNQSSGVSVRMSIANFETLAANALRRALELGEPEAVPRISDLDALLASTQGKLELEVAGTERSEADLVRELVRRATKSVFDAVVSLEGIAAVTEAFEQGWQVEVSARMPSAEYLDGIEQIPGLREAAAGLAGGDSPARLASAIEFVLEGLHLAHRLNKSESEGRARYALRAAR
ncbi:MAG: sigma 54-interacting transcriptional regulator [Deltaproteobacteria bacterium]|nr:sigma 54-interacting transcriptional regulator [Deltaproteobacteria bacterium]